MLATAWLKLSEMLSGPFLLSVPPYQRPYSWGEQQVEQLLDDLTEAARLGSSKVVDDSYFLGTILLMDQPGNQTVRITPKMAPREFDIIDGQQRLVTMMTIFCVFRDLDAAQKSAIGKRVQAMVLAQHGKPFFRSERFRMHLSSRESAVFEKFVLAPGGTMRKPESPFLSPSEQALLAMRDRVVLELQKLTSRERGQLFQFIADKCSAVVIVSHDIDRAHRMFVVLNERGKQLQRDDILKADVLSRVPQSDVNWIAETWDKTGAELGKDFEVFFSHVRKIYGYDNRQVVSGVRAVIADAGGAEPFISNVFVPLAKTYQLIRSVDATELPGDIRRRLIYLNRLADGDWAPAAMLALKDWQSDPDRARMLISEIDRMAHIMRLLCAGTGKRVRRFSDIVDAIRSGVAIDENHPVFQVTREETRSIVFHLKDLHKRGPKICKLLLMRLGDSLGGRSYDIDPELYTIEHILPQRPSATSEWRRWFPTAEERSQCIESLGNLVLITQEQNDKARNASFEVKKAIYAEVTGSVPLLPITADVLAAMRWTREEIDGREIRLLNMIANMLRIDVPMPKLEPPASSGSGDVAAAPLTGPAIEQSKARAASRR
ncbi:MAG: DUF262 domain-containing HNH endonuclease family protein [Hyphomicrobium sp.]|nr:DUF262 domain-containing protein [Hyphomicrobium sp.]